jgi:hypothetical protein
MKRVYEYDLYFPLSNEHGTRAADDVFNETKRRLTEYFGGLTDFHHRSEGSWKFGGLTYYDEVVLLRVLSERRDDARAFLDFIKRELAAALGEKEILVIEREVDRL